MAGNGHVMCSADEWPYCLIPRVALPVGMDPHSRLRGLAYSVYCVRCLLPLPPFRSTRTSYNSRQGDLAWLQLPVSRRGAHQTLNCANKKCRVLRSKQVLIASPCDQPLYSGVGSVPSPSAPDRGTGSQISRQCHVCAGHTQHMRSPV